MTAERKLRLGVAGLGRAFMLMHPTLSQDARIVLSAAADPSPAARARFQREFGGRAYDSVAALCGDPALDAVYVATPHELHVEHVTLAARAGKHVLVEKPMALSLGDCQAMCEMAARAGVQLLVGHSHSFDAPYLRARALIEAGDVGRARMITALNCTDFLYRARRPEELDTAQGGGVVWSQAAHQVDIVRLLGGGRVRSVRAATGAWDRARPTEGAYSAFLTFDDGAFATLTYSGYAHFDTDEFQSWIGELGDDRRDRRHGETRARLRELGSPEAEAALKATRTYGAGAAAPVGAGHNHFGFVLVSCDRADLRPMPHGVVIYGDDAITTERLPAPAVPRSEVIDELYDAVVHATPPLHSGAWGLATTEVCLAILRSAKEGRELTMSHQCETLPRTLSPRG